MQDTELKVGVIGLGYVGLTTAVTFAELGFPVYGMDKDERKLDVLRKGISPIYEPGLEELLRKNLDEGRLSFVENIADVVRNTNVIFICVGTPTNEDGSPDLSQVEEVARNIAEHIDDYKVIVEKSTVPVNTALWIKRTLMLYSGKDIEFDVVSNPEFLREGNAIHDTFHPDRIVIGVESERAKNIMLKLYEKIDTVKLITDIKTAEIIKHASNAFLAMKISFINMVSDLCDETGADVKMVADGMGYDRRIGREFLNAGVGYGGSCFPKDVRAFKYIGEQYNLDFSLLEAVERINNSRIDKLFRFVRMALWNVKDKNIAVWGLSFKPNTDDIREAPSIKVVGRLVQEGANVRAYDPKAMDNFRKLFPDITYGKDMYDILEGAHALIILTEWEDFRKADLGKVKELMKTPIIIDGRNIYEYDELERFGFEYYPMGRGRWLRRF